MYYFLMMTIHQIIDCIRHESFSDFIHKRFYRNRVLVPVEMDLLQDISFLGHRNSNYQFIEVKLEDLKRKSFTYSITSRYYKALRNLKKGYRDFAILADKKVVGDVWCTTTEACGESHTHEDVYITGLNCRDREIYAFDMKIDPRFRGKNLATPLQRFLQSTLKNEGYLKVYGYYWQDNLNALWMHRLLKFKEHPRRQVTRFLSYVRAEEFDLAGQTDLPADALSDTAERCWEYKNYMAETKASCRASIQTEQQCWELFMENGRLMEKCENCQFSSEKMPKEEDQKQISSN